MDVARDIASNSLATYFIGWCVGAFCVWIGHRERGR